MSLSEGSAGTLWHANYKINTSRRGFQWKNSIAGVDEAAAVAAAEDIATRMKKLLPGDAEIVFATLSNDNSVRDATFLDTALGVGEYESAAGPPPVPGQVDQDQTAIQLRLENIDRQSVQRYYNPIPDNILAGDALAGSVTNVLTMPGVIDAAGAATWYLEFGNFMKTLVKLTHYVKSGHAPGGVYQYAAWRKCFVIRTTKKKGGRSFI